VDEALKRAGIHKEHIDGVAFTKGPGLLGSLLVGVSFAKGFSLSRNIPLLEVNHLQAHILAHYIKMQDEALKHPNFPFLALLVSGGHSQLVIVHDYLSFEIIGNTIDDAAGEAFDKCAKIMGLEYPGGPIIDSYAKKGNPRAFQFNKPDISDLNYSFSGLKTNFLYFIRDKLKEDSNFIKDNLNNLCSSLQQTIVEILTDKLVKASQQTGIKEIALAGGVAANSYLRDTVYREAEHHNWQVYVPKFTFTTDNAAMIAITGYFKYLNKQYANLDVEPKPRL